MMKKILVIALVLMTLSAIFALGAYVYEEVIPGDVVVVETPSGDYEVQAFNDSACTEPLTEVNWGSMQCGESKSLHFYVKNTGGQNISGVTVTVDSPVNYVGGHGYDLLAVNESYEVIATLKIDPESSAGSYSADVVIECTA